MFCPNCNNLYDIKDTDKGDCFVCSICDNVEPIKPGTLLLSKSNEDNEVENINPKYKKNVNALMHTTNYICPNKSCETHKNAKLKDAIIEYTKDNSYKIRYICLNCNTEWINNPSYK